MTKSSVSVLHEFVAKHKLVAPEFDFIESEEGFVCRVTIGDMSADGIGRSKRDAKHLATANIIKKMKDVVPEIGEIPVVAQADLPTTDTYAALRDFCVQNEYPLPTIEIVQQGGTPDSPLFVALCQVASIKRYGKSEKKKDAKQLAAHSVLSVITHSFIPELKQQLVSTVEQTDQELECKRRLKFRTYRELTDAKINYTAVKLIDRHMYFTKYKPQLKAEALKIINSQQYESTEQQARDILAALQLTPRIKELKAEGSVEPFLFIELDCDYDAVFAGVDLKVWKQIIEYFKIMLV